MTKTSLSYESAVKSAIAQFELRRLGWRGFSALPWVNRLTTTYPIIAKIDAEASIIGGGFREPATTLMASAAAADREAICRYFLGKLALEQLSCDQHGAGAGACDRRAAYLEIWETVSR